MRCEEEILNLIDSNYMRNYLYTSINDLTVHEYIEIIAGAPTSLEKKAELLKKLSEIANDPKDIKYTEFCYQAVMTALDRLYHMDRTKSQLLLLSYDTQRPGAVLTSAEPVLSYEGVIDYIRNDYYGLDEESEEEIEQILNSFSENFFRLELYDITEQDTLSCQYKYICTANGEIQYFEKVIPYNKRPRPRDRMEYLKEHCNELFKGRTMEEMMTPYQPGDILYIDCKPYLPPTYCLISYVSKELPFDCCCLRCIYPEYGGLVQEGALKHGHFYPSNDDYYGSVPLSPLYRAELYQGDLPEPYTFLKTVSEAIKQNPHLSDKIDHYFLDDSEKHRKIKCVVEYFITDTEDYVDGVPLNTFMEFIEQNRE